MLTVDQARLELDVWGWFLEEYREGRDNVAELDIPACHLRCTGAMTRTLLSEGIIQSVSDESGTYPTRTLQEKLVEAGTEPDGFVAITLTWKSSELWLQVSRSMVYAECVDIVVLYKGPRPLVNLSEPVPRKEHFLAFVRFGMALANSGEARGVVLYDDRAFDDDWSILKPESIVARR